MTDSSNSSLLSEIISTSQGANMPLQSTNNPPPIPSSTIVTGNTGGGDNSSPPPQKKREPMSPLTLLKGIGAIFLVAVIFFGSFLAYIVFHPEQAQFFVSTFGIDPRDVADLLRILITGSFGFILLLLSITWIVILFRAIWTPREMKRKKMLSWILAIFIGIILFSFVAFWAYLFTIINNTNFVNPEGNINVSDSDLLGNPLTINYAPLQTTSNLIGPINLTFDISANASQIEKKNLIKIQSYDINFDGAICNDGSSIIRGVSPTESKGISCTFDKTHLYEIKGTYHGVDRLGKEIDIPMNMNPVEIRGILSITKQKNRNNEDIITIDASNLKNLGNPRWAYNSTNEEVNASYITEKLTSTPQIIGFKLFSENMDRIFLLENIDEKGFTGSIDARQDPYNPLKYQFTITGLNINDSEIISTNWSLNDGSIICRGGSLTCDYSFGSFDTYTVRARIQLANKDIIMLEHPAIKIQAPLIVSRRAQITDENGKLLNTDETFDPKLHAYVIKDIIPPTKISFDARDVVTESLGYKLSRVTWNIADGKSVEEKEGLQVSHTLSHPVRYTVTIHYTFTPNIPGGKDEEKESQENVIFDIEHKTLIPRFSLQVPSDYAPVVVTIDGSQSYAENSEIKKFTYDFGDGKPPVSGDAIQQYEYKTPGEKTVTLTITNDKGDTETLRKTLVIKDNPKVVDFVPSISPAITGMPVDFSPTVSENDVAEYIWTFGDNTQTIKEPFPSHTFSSPGKYIVTLIVVYSNGTRNEARKEVTVVDEMQ